MGWIPYNDLEMPQLAKNRGQINIGSAFTLLVSTFVLALIGVGIVMPIVNEVIAKAGIDGLTALIVGFIPVAVALIIFIGVVKPIMS